jgi:hypothetical protein
MQLSPPTNIISSSAPQACSVFDVVSSKVRSHDGHGRLVEVVAVSRACMWSTQNRQDLGREMNGMTSWHKVSSALYVAYGALPTSDSLRHVVTGSWIS